MNSVIVFAFAVLATVVIAIMACRRWLVGVQEFDDAVRYRSGAYLVRDFIVRSFVAMHVVWDRALGPGDMARLMTDPWVMYGLKPRAFTVMQATGKEK